MPTLVLHIRVVLGPQPLCLTKKQRLSTSTHHHPSENPTWAGKEKPQTSTKPRIFFRNHRTLNSVDAEVIAYDDVSSDRSWVLLLGREETETHERRERREGGQRAGRGSLLGFPQAHCGPAEGRSSDEKDERRAGKQK